VRQIQDKWSNAQHRKEKKENLDRLPFDSFFDVLLLLRLQRQFNEKLLKFLIAAKEREIKHQKRKKKNNTNRFEIPQINAKLLKAVILFSV
jgi:hypothetical protein